MIRLLAIQSGMQFQAVTRGLRLTGSLTKPRSVPLQAHNWILKILEHRGKNSVSNGEDKGIDRSRGFPKASEDGVQLTHEQGMSHLAPLRMPIPSLGRGSSSEASNNLDPTELSLSSSASGPESGVG